MYTLERISKIIGARLEGDPKIKIASPNEPKACSSNQLAMALSDRYVKDINLGMAKVALFTKAIDWKTLNLKAALFLEGTKQSLYELNKLFYQHPKYEKGVSSKSSLSKTVTIGENTSVGAFCSIGDNCKIGNNVVIYPNVTIFDNVSIGDGCIIFPGVVILQSVLIGREVICHSNTVIGSDGFSYFSDSKEGIEKVMSSRSDTVEMSFEKYLKVESLGSVEISDQVEIGSNCTIDRGSISNTVIGVGTKLDNLVHIAHNVKIGSNCLICGQVGIAGSTIVGDRVVMGGQAGVGDNIEIGNDVVLAGKTGLSVNAKPNQFLMGNPAMKKSVSIASYIALRRLPSLIKKLKKR
jgi:UDP-3-O-[3-hydroxymyristoyl] glucosamine N-acyltransferase